MVTRVATVAFEGIATRAVDVQVLVSSGIVGGGLHAKPGEVSLAHRGVLFLDEFAELDSLRQPLESGEVAISRANHRTVYPARFQLVAAMNPCRCGHANEPGYACKRQPNERCMAQYQSRLSGPLLDRIDIRVELAAMTAADLVLPPPAEGSAEVAQRVAAARERQAKRYEAHGVAGDLTNAACPPALLAEVAKLDFRGAHLAARRGRGAAADGARLSPRHQARPNPHRSRGRRGDRPYHLAEALSHRIVADRVGEAA